MIMDIHVGDCLSNVAATTTLYVGVVPVPRKPPFSFLIVTYDVWSGVLPASSRLIRAAVLWIKNPTNALIGGSTISRSLSRGVGAKGTS